MECEDCTHWFISPIVAQNQLTLLYENASEYVVSNGWQPERKDFSIPEKYIIRSESQNPKSGKKYLEIGIGRGLLFKYFINIGYECFAVDPGPWARYTPNLVKDITEFDQADFDVIVMADVLEHVEDPLSLVKRIGALVNAGTVYACFPNSQSLRARLSKNNWRMVRPFGHLHFFSEKSLLAMFQSSGFKVKRMMSSDLIEFSFRSLFRPFHFFPINFISLLTQHVWGDQWIVHAEK